MSRYLPSRRYLWAGLTSWALAAVSGFLAINWPVAAIGVALFLMSSGFLIYLALRPPIEIRERHLVVGNRAILWSDIRRVDRTAWITPLIVRITLIDDGRLLLVYPGDLDSSNSLLRHIRRHAGDALLDGKTYGEFWGESPPAAPERRELPSPRYRLLRREDELDVERLYHQLKTVGRLDPKNSGDEK